MMHEITEREAAQAVSRHKISASTLSALRWATKSDMTVQSLAYDLVNGSEETRSMRIGTAWHEILEDATVKNSFRENIANRIDKHGFTFAIDTDILIPKPTATEKKIVKYYNLNGHAVRISAVIDAMTEKTLIEYKTTKHCVAESYLASPQWRLYMMITGYTSLDYHIFTIQDRKDAVHIAKQTVLNVRHYNALVLELETEMLAAIRIYQGAGIRTNDEWQLEFE